MAALLTTTCDCVVADTPVRSPQKLCSFIMKQEYRELGLRHTPQLFGNRMSYKVLDSGQDRCF